MKNSVIRFLPLLFLLTSCATENRSVGLGGAVGASSGALIGGIADPGRHGELRTRNVVIGATLGAMTGMVAGSILHNESEKSKREAFLSGQKSGQVPVSGDIPSLSTPKVETHWIEGKVQGNRYIEGHFEYVIIEPVRWDVK